MKVHAAVAVVFGPATLLRLVLANARVMLVTVLDVLKVSYSWSGAQVASFQAVELR